MSSSTASIFRILHYINVFWPFAGVALIFIWVFSKDRVLMWQEIFRAIATFFLFVAAIQFGADKGASGGAWVSLVYGLIFQAGANVVRPFYRNLSDLSSRYSWLSRRSRVDDAI
jgi:hypothetical protein